MTGNPIFPAIGESPFRRASEYYRPRVRAPGAEALTLAGHERIAGAIASHDGATAEFGIARTWTDAAAMLAAEHRAASRHSARRTS